MTLTVPPRLGAIAGLAGIGTWTALYLTAVALYPGYSVVDNFLSDLGHPDAPGNWAFNAACILGGILFLPFGLAIGSVLGGRLGQAGGLLLALAGIALVLVGVFPEESPNNLHFLVSLSFFLLLTAAAATLALPLHNSRDFGPLVGILAGVTVAGSLAFVVSGGTKILEHVAVYAGLAWAAASAVRLAMKRP